MGEEHIPIVSRAARERLTVQMAYRDAKGDTTTRQVDVQWMSGEYFGGYCRLRGAQRSFRIDRVAAASVVGSHERPKTSPPDDIEFWGRSAGSDGYSFSGGGSRSTTSKSAVPGWVWWAAIIGFIVIVAVIG